MRKGSRDNLKTSQRRSRQRRLKQLFEKWYSKLQDRTTGKKCTPEAAIIEDLGIDMKIEDPEVTCVSSSQAQEPSDDGRTVPEINEDEIGGIVAQRQQGSL